MNFKNIFGNTFKRIKNYFTLDDLDKDSLNYITYGFGPQVRTRYNIDYSPSKINLKKKNLEGRVTQDVQDERPEMDFSKRVKVDYLRSMNEIYSSIIETYNKVSKKVSDAAVEMIDGGYRISFG